MSRKKKKSSEESCNNCDMHMLCRFEEKGYSWCALWVPEGEFKFELTSGEIKTGAELRRAIEAE